MAKVSAKKFSLLALVLASLTAALIAGGVVYLWQQRKLSPAPITSDKSEEEQIIEVVKDHVEKDTDDTRASYSLTKRVDNFAIVSVSVRTSSTNSTHGYIVKKVAGTWGVLRPSFQNIPDDETLRQLGIPKELYAN